jgi:hypothetical protein
MKQSGHLTMPALNLIKSMKHLIPIGFFLGMIVILIVLTGCITFTVKDDLDPLEVNGATDVIESVGGTIAKDF